MMMDAKSWYISQFPESMFQCRPQDIEKYVINVIRGKDFAQHRNVLILGIIRNCANILPYTMARIEKLGSYFKNYHVFLFENDSVDTTKSMLVNWSNTNNHINFESDTFNPPPFTDPYGHDRRYFMAKSRNQYMFYAISYIIKNNVDYIIILDSDLIGGWSYHGVFNSLGQSDLWDIVGSNSLCYTKREDKWIRLFYDSWAFRPLGQSKYSNDDNTDTLIFHRGQPLIQVNSCFGGLAIYKPYFLTEELLYNEYDCDHATLHNALIEKGYKIFLNPSQITLYNNSQYII